MLLRLAVRHKSVFDYMVAHQQEWGHWLQVCRCALRCGDHACAWCSPMEVLPPAAFCGMLLQSYKEEVRNRQDRYPYFGGGMNNLGMTGRSQGSRGWFM